MNTDSSWTVLAFVIYIVSSTKALSVNFGYSSRLERPIYLLAIPYGERTIPEYELVFQPSYEQQNRRNDYDFKGIVSSTTNIPSRRTDYVLKDTISTTNKTPTKGRGSIKYGDKTSVEPEILENRSSHFHNKESRTKTENSPTPTLSKELVFESRILLNKPIIRTDDVNIAGSENNEARRTRPTFTPSRRKSNNKNDTVTNNQVVVETTTAKIHSRNRDVKSIYTADNSRNFFRNKLRKNETLTENVEKTTPTPLVVKQTDDGELANKQTNNEDNSKNNSRREKQKLPEGIVEYGHKKTAASENEDLTFINTPPPFVVNIPSAVNRNPIKPQVNVDIPVSKNVPVQQTTVELSRAPTRETPVQQSKISSRIPTTKNLPVQQTIITPTRASANKNLPTQETIITPSRTSTTKNIPVQQTIVPSRTSANKNILLQTISRVPVQKTAITTARLPPSNIRLQEEIITGVRTSGTKNFQAQQNFIVSKFPVIKEDQRQQNVITVPRTPTKTRNTLLPENYIQSQTTKTVPRAPQVQAPVDVHITHRGTRKYRPQLEAYNVDSDQNSLPISTQNTEQDWKPMIPQRLPQQYHQEVFPEPLFHPAYQQQFYHDTPRQSYNHEQSTDNHKYKKNYKNHPQSHQEQYVYFDYGPNGQVSYSLPYSGISQNNEFYYQQ